MTEQEKIEQAARKYATEKSTAPDKETPDWIEQDFKAGVTFALSELCPARMGEFAEWCATSYDKSTVSEDIWSQRESRVPYSTKELLEQYLEHLKQKQDATK